MKQKLARYAGILLLVLLINTAYIAAFASPTIFYMGNAVLHLALGLALAVMLLWLIRRTPVAGGLFLAAALAGIFLAVRGNTTPHRWVLEAHIVVAAAALLALVPYVFRHTGAGFRNAYVTSLALLVILPGASALYRKAYPDPNDRIRNPLVVPVSMNEEGGGPRSPFFPSSAKTNVGGIIPSNFFMDSEACGRCHQDIYEQWKSSMHHFASFNNQFYRKSIEYMQSVVGTQPSKWCAGCHDHAVFFNGRFDRPIKDQIDTPEARAGLSCTSCHAVTHVDSSMGNASFTLQYPPLHQFLSSKNKLIQDADYFMTFLNPEPHRRTFMKPFLRQDVPEFCSGCHKVHLDVPVNQYRWFRGFNDYDNWQASGVSGQGARSFYYPPKVQNCADCHMPMVASQDPGNIGGQVHSHRFPAANTAVPYANQDEAQLELTRKFLTSGFISVDIFAVSPASEAGTVMVRRTGEGPHAMTGFAVGEEAEQSGNAVIREVGQVAAPVDHSGIHLEPGSTARVDVVVRTRKIGHFFPGGTVDAFDVWVELQGKDADGRVIFWSGEVEDGGKGPVEPGAHFYRAYQLDGDGNMINKRNAWQARSVLYVRLIPPGAADVVHYRVKIPKDAKGPLSFTAKLNYRKFSYYYTQFAYAGQPKPNQDPKLLTASYNGLEYTFDPHNIPQDVSGNIKDRIPDLPIITVASAKATVPLGPSSWTPVVRQEDRERWNDWGIGLLLQGDLKGAEYAFKKVTEAEPGYADGWLNVARALVQEGETDAAKPYIQQALKINDKLGRIWFFKAMIEKADGKYDEALKSLAITLGMYPRDRVALNQAARILFLQRKYAEAAKYLDRVCDVDPEDLQMHYTRMLCLRGLGDAAGAGREQALFQRFKAEESAQALTAKPRLLSPENNNERQQIHDHDSVPLNVPLPHIPGAQMAHAAEAAGGGQ
ncbi:MAG TPA: tetratricopeptide repeat protein [Bryobacteraceae bacterium]|jgi:tetratricopeptide (TPR) repeat protein|nr:tetratricopeptide repeat protein [Bryobacteraceae bacterium]